MQLKADPAVEGQVAPVLAIQIKAEPAMRASSRPTREINKAKPNCSLRPPMKARRVDGARYFPCTTAPQFSDFRH